MTMRRARAEELATVLDWAAAEGWNPGLEDAQAFFAADPEGFFLAERDGEIVAAISVVNHSDSFAFLGLYLCRPDWRGKGVGYALWQHALGHAGDRTIGLDGVPAQEANYAASGFLRTGATRQFEGRVDPAESPDIRSAAPSDATALGALDQAANGVSRPAFLTEWTRLADSRFTLVLEDGAALTGFATLRRCRAGAKLGPVIAPDPASALRLMQHAAALAPDTALIVGVPEASTGFLRTLAAEGFTETFSTARMYRGPAPETGASLQAIATMELG